MVNHRDVPSGQPPQRPERRVVLLGASNLVRGLATVLDTAGRHWGQPLEVFIAAGHGRSFGIYNTVLGRTLPGITQCRLWETMSQQQPLPTAALLTDIGNDLLFHVPAERVAGWVEQCLDQLRQLEACTIMTSLPIANLDRLTPQSFYFLRSLLFPRCRLSYDHVFQQAHELDQRVRDLARAHHIPIVEPRREWYGFDPIHIRLSKLPEVWREILAGWCPGEAPSAARSSWVRWARLRLLRPDQRWLLGIEQRRVQPAAQWHDGTSISLF